MKRPATFIKSLSNGIKGKEFLSEDVTGKVPDWIKTYLYHAERNESDREKHFMVGDDEATLLYMARFRFVLKSIPGTVQSEPDYPPECNCRS